MPDATETGVDCKIIKYQRGKGQEIEHRVFQRTEVFLLLSNRSRTSIFLMNGLVTENCSFNSPEIIPKFKLNWPITSHVHIYLHKIKY